MSDFWIVTIGMQLSFLIGIAFGYGLRRGRETPRGNYIPCTGTPPDGSVPPKPRK